MGRGKTLCFDHFFQLLQPVDEKLHMYLRVFLSSLCPEVLKILLYTGTLLHKQIVFPLVVYLIIKVTGKVQTKVNMRAKLNFEQG
jgi:hypothetical protein